MFHCLYNKRGTPLIYATNIRTGVEQIFSLRTDSKRFYIWRESGVQNFPSNIMECDRFGRAGMMGMGKNNGR